ncbi:hypothetical protein [Bacillus sp. REN3]|uniref:hypothetical protein n=1 Tax=Bacillus sp. REN3 TaxID=2802440 RepID=UPI001AEEF4A8|nr:hypothetical protein [Bacillus sp. REN3]
MEKRKQKPARQLELEKGITEVSQQIMDSYNSGVIGQEQKGSIIETEEEQR